MTPVSKFVPCLEKRLLVCCARTNLTPEGAKTLREILASKLDWDYLLWEAEENSVTPLLGRHLSAVAPGATPPAAQEHLGKIIRANTVRCARGAKRKNFSLITTKISRRSAVPLDWTRAISACAC